MEKGTQQADVGNDFEGNLIQGDYNNSTFIKNEIDGEELGQSLGEALSKSAQWEWWREADREDSRQVMETIFVSIVSGLAIGASWKFVFPWNLATIPFFVIGTIVLFNVLKVTNFGLRRSIFKVIFVSTAFSLFLQYTLLAQTWMEINQFVGSTMLATLGAIIGLFVGLIQTFWRPLED